MSKIAICHLLPHPDNANRMNDAMLDKLALHIERHGKYPSLIVRPHPSVAEHFQVMDGHHRLLVLQRLGYDEADCEVWDIDDNESALMLLTLNRLHGEDDPQRRGALLARLNETLSLPEMVKLLPDDVTAIGKLLELMKPPPELVRPMDPNDMPQAVTFFLNERQKKRLFEKLRDLDRDRSRALMVALDLEAVL